MALLMSTRALAARPGHAQDIRSRPLRYTAAASSSPRRASLSASARLVADRREELARRTQRLVRFRLSLRGQASSLSEQRVGALGHVPERAPALRGLGEEPGGQGVITGGLGEQGASRADRVLVDRRQGLDAVHEVGARALDPRRRARSA